MNYNGVQIDLSRNELFDELGLKTLHAGYLLEGETPQEGFARAAIAYSAGDMDLAQRLYDYASLHWFGFATPLLVSAGNERGLPVSCFLNEVDDSIDGLVDHFSENAYLATRGGGIGSYWGNVRSIGQVTSKGVETPGVLSFMHVSNAQILAYHQGSTRRGAYAAFMDVDHPEIIEFIGMRSPTGGDKNRKNEHLHHGVCIPDWFMHKVENDEEYNLIDPNSKQVTDTLSARDVFARILRQRVQTGEPYIIFTDTATKGLHKSLQDKNFKIKTSNLCQPDFASIIKKVDDAPALVTMGDVEVGDEIWSETGWTRVVKKWSNGAKEVFKYRTTSGEFIGTANHRILEKGEKIEVDDASSIDALAGPEVSKFKHNPQDIMEGLVVGDGMMHKASNNKIILIIGQDDQDYLSSEVKDLIVRKCSVCPMAHDVNTTVEHLEHTYNRRIPERYFESQQKMASFLRGLFSANGTVVGKRVAYATSSREMVDDLQKALSFLGMRSYYTFNKGKETEFSNGTYLCKDSWNVNISLDRKVFYSRVGFLQNYKMERLLKTIEGSKSYGTGGSYSVIDKESLGEHEVFDITVDNEPHTYWTGGVNASNCVEIMQPTKTDRTAVCVLSSINLAKYLEWKDIAKQFISDLITMLDNVIDVFVKKAPQTMWRAIKGAVKERSLGLGAMGFQTLIQSLNLTMDSKECFDLNKEMFSTIHKYAKETTRQLAIERGEPEDLIGSGDRNANLIAIAPNASSSLILNVSPSIEPFNGNFQVQKTTVGSTLVSNPVFVKLLKEKGVYSEQLVADITKNEGSVQDLDFLTDHEKQVFKNAIEIDQQVLVDLAAQRQPYICQAQSLNLFVDPKIAPRPLIALHMSAWKQGLKSLYYCRSKSVKETNEGQKVETPQLDQVVMMCAVDGSECVACEG